MTPTMENELAGAETLINQACDDAVALNHGDRLRRLFLRISAAVRELGDVIVSVDGRAASIPPCTPPARIIELAGRSPEKFCVYRLDPCGGAPKPFVEGNQLQDGDKLIVTLCTPPPDGADRRQALAQDLERLRDATRKARVVQLREGAEAVLAELVFPSGSEATVGVLITPQYPAVAPDWFLLDSRFTIDGFSGQKRGPYHEGERALVEYSIHPAPGVVAAASDQILNVLVTKLALIRSVTA